MTLKRADISRFHARLAVEHLESSRRRRKQTKAKYCIAIVTLNPSDYYFSACVFFFFCFVGFGLFWVFSSSFSGFSSIEATRPRDDGERD